MSDTKPQPNHMITVTLAFMLACMLKVFYHALLAPDVGIMWTWIGINILGSTLLTISTPHPDQATPTPALVHLQCHLCPSRKTPNPFTQCILFGGLRVTVFSGGLFDRCLGGND